VLPPFSSDTNITVLHSDALVWFESPDDTGPHFTVQCVPSGVAYALVTNQRRIEMRATETGGG
jgi:hypothetical protein